MSDIDRILYASVGLALAAVVLLDPTFAENLARAFGPTISTPSIRGWPGSVARWQR